jgi:hypothetical protein
MLPALSHPPISLGRMARFSKLAAMAVVSVVAAVPAACGGGGASGAGGGSLRSAMASVRDVPASERFFAWADDKELRKLTGVSAASDTSKAKADQKWLRLTQVALPAVADKEPQFTAATGIDGYGGARDITIGLPPEQASRVDGADGWTVLRKFRQLGAREQRVAGRTYLAVADEGQVDVSNPHLGDDVYLALNRVFVNGSTVAFGLSDPPIDAVLGGGGRSLADVPAMGALADCLGDVFVAELSAPAPGGPDGVSLVGIGVRRPAAKDAPVTEVLCEAAKSKDQAGQLAGSIGARVAPEDTLPGNHHQIRDRIAQAGVDQTGKGDQHLVRLTMDLVTPARAGFLLFDAGSSALAFLEGGGSTGNGP